MGLHVDSGRFPDSLASHWLVNNQHRLFRYGIAPEADLGQTPFWQTRHPVVVG